MEADQYVKFRGYKKTKSNIVTSAINKPKLTSSEALGLKYDKIVKSKFTVANDLKHRTKKKKQIHEPVAETPEFKLLCKLFVPPKFLIHNDKVAVRQLYGYLPLLTSLSDNIESSQSMLNLELHLFLCAITTNYITTWYSKLDTDNLDFIRSVYDMLCDFTKDLIRRVQTTFLTNLLLLIDDLCLILNNHITDLVSECNHANEIKFVEQFSKSGMNRNALMDLNYGVDHIFQKYLSDNHVIFEGMNLNQRNQKTENSFKEQAEDQRLMYFRLISKNILTASFDTNRNSDSLHLSSPTTSHITMNLLIVLISDLIFDKLFEKLSSPEFLLQTSVDAITDLSSKISSDRKSFESEDSGKKATSKGNLIYASYINVKNFVLNMHHISDSRGSYDNETVLQSQIFPLIDTLTGFSNRKPLLASFIKYMKRLIMSSKPIAKIAGSISKWFVYNKISNSEVFSEESCCKILRGLRENLFSESNGSDKLEGMKTDQVDITHFSNKIFEALFTKLPNSILLGPRIAESLKYKNEKEEDIKQSIYNLLVIFNYNHLSMDNNTLNQTCFLNQLLIIHWVDCIISNLYPEFLSK